MYFLSVCPCDHSWPQRHGLWGHRERLRRLAPSGNPQHIWPLDTHPLAGRPTDARLACAVDLWVFSHNPTKTSIMRCLVILYWSVIGALIGKQEGRNIEVMNSFELLSHTIDDRVHIDKEYYYTKEEQCEYSGWCACCFLFICELWTARVASDIYCNNYLQQCILVSIGSGQTILAKQTCLLKRNELTDQVLYV